MPRFGQHRLDRLQPEHLERLYRADGRALVPGPRRLIRCIGLLGRRWARRFVVGMSRMNAAALAKPPRVEPEEVEPYSLEDVRRILSAAAGLAERSPVGRRARPRTAPR